MVGVGGGALVSTVMNLRVPCTAGIPVLCNFYNTRLFISHKTIKLSVLMEIQCVLCEVDLLYDSSVCNSD
jgi:hypothetical protein